MSVVWRADMWPSRCVIPLQICNLYGWSHICKSHANYIIIWLLCRVLHIYSVDYWVSFKTFMCWKKSVSNGHYIVRTQWNVSYYRILIHLWLYYSILATNLRNISLPCYFALTKMNENSLNMINFIYIFTVWLCNGLFISSHFTRCTHLNYSRLLHWYPGNCVIADCTSRNQTTGIHYDVTKWKYFRVTGPLWGESTGNRWFPLKKASDAELWYFLGSAPEQTVEQTIETPMISVPSRSSWRHCNVYG